MCKGLADCHQRHQCHRNGSRPPSGHVVLLRHCRCRDCENWIGHLYNECDEGIIRNGVKPVPEHPPDAWHYCAAYDGQQVSKDVWVWRRRPRKVGPGSDIPTESTNATAVSAGRDGGEDGGAR